MKKRGVLQLGGIWYLQFYGDRYHNVHIQWRNILEFFTFMELKASYIMLVRFTTHRMKILLTWWMMQGWYPRASVYHPVQVPAYPYCWLIVVSGSKPYKNLSDLVVQGILLCNTKHEKVNRLLFLLGLAESLRLRGNHITTFYCCAQILFTFH